MLALTIAVLSCRSTKSLIDRAHEENFTSDPEMIKRVLESGHTSILEHISFTFTVENASLVARSQLFRHRLMSVTEQSKRSIDANLIDFIIPPAIAKDIVLTDRFIAAMDRSWDSYSKLVQMGVHKEDARYVLPVAQSTQFVCTVNGRELFDVIFPLRMCKRTQEETRDIVNQMYAICMCVVPCVFKLTGPRCIVTGKCNEMEKCKANG